MTLQPDSWLFEILSTHGNQEIPMDLNTHVSHKVRLDVRACCAAG